MNELGHCNIPNNGRNQLHIDAFLLGNKSLRGEYLLRGVFERYLTSSLAVRRSDPYVSQGRRSGSGSVEYVCLTQEVYRAPSGSSKLFL